jgi:hypothetical protein
MEITIRNHNLKDGDKLKLTAQDHITDISKTGSRTPLSIPLTPIEDLRGIDDMVLKIQKHMKYEEAPFENITWSLQFVKKPSGGTTHRYSVKDYEELKERKCFIQIKNEGFDNACLARSPVIVKAKAEGYYDENFRKRNAIRKDATEAHKLCEEAKVSKDNFCSLEDIKKFEDVLKYNVVVYDLQKSRLYRGEAFENPITKIKAFMGKDYWCDKCLKAYTIPEGHSKCSGIKRCLRCRQLNCEGQYKKNVNWEFCEDGGCAFYDHQCLVNNRTYEICAKKFRCQSCKMTFNIHPKIQFFNYVASREDHLCGFDYCKNGFGYVETLTHKCFMKKAKLKAPHDYIIYFDFETYINEDNEFVVGNLAVAMFENDKYYEEAIDGPSKVIHGNLLYLKFLNIEDFTKWLLKKGRVAQKEKEKEIEKQMDELEKKKDLRR